MKEKLKFAISKLPSVSSIEDCGAVSRVHLNINVLISNKNAVFEVGNFLKSKNISAQLNEEHNYWEYVN